LNKKQRIIPVLVAFAVISFILIFSNTKDASAGSIPQLYDQHYLYEVFSDQYNTSAPILSQYLISGDKAWIQVGSNNPSQLANFKGTYFRSGVDVEFVKRVAGYQQFAIDALTYPAGIDIFRYIYENETQYEPKFTANQTNAQPIWDNAMSTVAAYNARTGGHAKLWTVVSYPETSDPTLWNAATSTGDCHFTGSNGQNHQCLFWNWKTAKTHTDYLTIEVQRFQEATGHCVELTCSINYLLQINSTGVQNWFMQSSMETDNGHTLIGALNMITAGTVFNKTIATYEPFYDYEFGNLQNFLLQSRTPPEKYNKDYNIFGRDWVGNLNAGTKQIMEINNNTIANGWFDRANDTYYIQAVYPNAPSATIQSYVTAHSSLYKPNVEFGEILYYKQLAVLQANLTHEIGGAKLIYYDLERGTGYESPLLYPTAPRQAATEALITNASNAALAYNARTGSTAKFAIWLSWSQIGTGENSGTPTYTPFNFTHLCSLPNINYCGIGFNGQQGNGALPIILSLVKNQTKLNNPYNYRTGFTISGDNPSNGGKDAETMTKYLWLSKDSFLKNFDIFFTASANPSALYKMDAILTVTNGIGKNVTGNTNSVPVGLWHSSGLNSDAIIKATVQKYGDNNDILIGNASEASLFQTFSGYPIRMLLTHSVADVSSAITTIGGWGTKPTDILYESMSGITPATELSNVTGAVLNASTLAHNAGLKFTWSPNYTQTFVPNEGAVDLTKIDRVVLELDNQVKNGSNNYAADVQSVVSSFHNAIPISFSQFIKPNTAGLKVQTSLIGAEIHSPAKTAGARVAYPNNFANDTACNTRTVMLDLPTTLPSGDNLIIAPVGVKSVDSSGKDWTKVQLYRGATLLQQPMYGLNAKSHLTTTSDVILWKDTGAPQNAHYTIEACNVKTNSAENGTAQISVLNNMPASAFTDSANTTLTGNVTTTLATASLTASYGANLAIANIEILDGTGHIQTIPVGSIQLLNGSNKVIAQNQLPINIAGNDTATQTANRYQGTFMGYDSNSTVNPTYTLKITVPKTAYVHGSLLVFQVDNNTIAPIITTCTNETGTQVCDNSTGGVSPRSAFSQGEAQILSQTATNTKTNRDTSGDVGSYASLAIGTDGFPIASYYNATSSNQDLIILHCSTVSCSSQNNRKTLDTTGNVCQYTSIAIGSDGFAIISYYDVTNGDLKLVHCTNTACTTNDTPVTLDSTGNVGQYTSIAIGSDGFAIISYYDVTNGDLKLVHCTNAACSTNDATRVLDSTGDVGSYSSIAIGSDGFPIISYYDTTNFALKSVHCINTACSSINSPQTIDTGNVGQFTSNAIGSDNFEIISYYDLGNTDLKFVHCTNTACSAHDTPLILTTSGGIVGQYSSIVKGVDGFPLVSFYDNTNGVLKVKHCTNLTCTTTDPSNIVDTQSDVGKYTSMKIGSDNFPIIGYYYVHSGDFRTTECGSQFCTPPNVTAQTLSLGAPNGDPIFAFSTTQGFSTTSGQHGILLGNSQLIIGNGQIVSNLMKLTSFAGNSSGFFGQEALNHGMTTLQSPTPLNTNILIYPRLSLSDDNPYVIGSNWNKISSISNGTIFYYDPTVATPLQTWKSSKTIDAAWTLATLEGADPLSYSFSPLTGTSDPFIPWTGGGSVVTPPSSGGGSSSGGASTTVSVGSTVITIDSKLYRLDFGANLLQEYFQVNWSNTNDITLVDDRLGSSLVQVGLPTLPYVLKANPTMTTGSAKLPFTVVIPPQCSVTTTSGCITQGSYDIPVTLTLSTSSGTAIITTKITVIVGNTLTDSLVPIIIIGALLVVIAFLIVKLVRHVGKQRKKNRTRTKYDVARERIEKKYKIKR